ncbi:MAG: ABC transporter ATP-binding protein [Pseudomonadota bacterium]
MNTPVASFKNFNISLSSKAKTILVEDLNFDINANETLCVVGESGSGKSTTALSLMGLLPPALKPSGIIEFQGRNVLSMSENELLDLRGRQVAMIFQEPMTSLNPVLTVGEQLAEPLVLHEKKSWSDARGEALRLMDLVRIPDSKTRLNAFPHQLSGGMRQRVMIAMALACKPSLLIADEPTTALDVTIQAEILELMKDLKAEIGMSLLFITHDLGVVAEIADRVLVMKAGKKVEEGEVDDLFSNPEQPYTRDLLSAVPRLGSLNGTATPKKFPPLGSGKVDQDIDSETDRRGKKILEVKNLRTRFNIRSGLLKRVTGYVPAVENISFDIRAGETLALVGESGCGKSTAGRSLLQLVDVSAGSVKFMGQEIHGAPPKEVRKLRQNLQMIFQDPFGSLNPRQSIRSCLAEPMKVHNIVPRDAIDDRISELLELVGLKPEHADRYPHEFSGGQRQRICIARSLGFNPSLIVADESVSALDSTIKAQVINLMLELQEKLGMSYLFISHDIGAVERISHRVAVMFMGEIVEIGPRDAVLGNPQHPYTKRLMNAVPIADPSLSQVRKRLKGEEIKSRVVGLDWVPPKQVYQQVGDAHHVLDR